MGAVRHPFKLPKFAAAAAWLKLLSYRGAVMHIRTDGSSRPVPDPLQPFREARLPCGHA